MTSVLLLGRACEFEKIPEKCGVSATDGAACARVGKREGVKWRKERTQKGQVIDGSLKNSGSKRSWLPRMLPIGRDARSHDLHERSVSTQHCIVSQMGSNPTKGIQLIEISEEKRLGAQERTRTSA